MSACRAEPGLDWPYGWYIPAAPLVTGGGFDYVFLGFPLGSLAAKIAEENFEAISPNWVAG